MKKLLLINLVLIMVAGNIIASPWKKSLILSFTVSQSKAQYTGYDGSLAQKEVLSLGAMINGEFVRNTRISNWKNTLKVEYARTKAYDESTTFINKNWYEDLDQLMVDSVYRVKFQKHINPYLAVNMDTCMFDVDYLNEWKAFHPVQLRESGGLGIPIVIYNGHEFITRIGLFFQNYLRPEYFDENFNGLEVVLDYKGKLSETSIITSKMGLYRSTYEVIDVDDTTFEKEYIKMEWYNTLSTPITKFLNINASFNLYNTDITDETVNYEWEQNIFLSFYYNIF